MVDELTDERREYLSILEELLATPRIGGLAGAETAWATIAEFGVLELAAPGSVGTIFDVGLTLERLGAAGVGLPVLENAMIGVPLLARAPGAIAAEWTAALSDGRRKLAVMTANRGVALHAQDADGVIVLSEDGVSLLDAGHLRREPVPVPDPFLHSAYIEVADATPITTISDPGLSRWAYLLLLTGRAALLVGAMEAALAMTVDFTKERTQFGRPIGGFQAIKHGLVDLSVLIEASRALVRTALCEVADNMGIDQRAALNAAARASESAYAVGDRCYHFHGAIAHTWEYPLHLWIRRMQAWSLSRGDIGLLRRRAGALLFGSVCSPDGP